MEKNKPNEEIDELRENLLSCEAYDEEGDECAWNDACSDGRNVCCAFCEDVKDCEDVCPDIEEYGFTY